MGSVSGPALHHPEKGKIISMNSSSSITQPENEYYDYYPLDTNAGHALLAEDHEFVVNPQTGRSSWSIGSGDTSSRNVLVQDRSCGAPDPVGWPSMCPRTICSKGCGASRLGASPVGARARGPAQPPPNGARRLPGASASPQPGCHSCR